MVSFLVIAYAYSRTDFQGWWQLESVKEYAVFLCMCACVRENNYILLDSLAVKKMENSALTELTF